MYGNLIKLHWFRMSNDFLKNCPMCGDKNSVSGDVSSCTNASCDGFTETLFGFHLVNGEYQMLYNYNDHTIMCCKNVWDITNESFFSLVYKIKKPESKQECDNLISRILFLNLVK